MGEPQTPHFYDFGIFESVAKPQNQLFVSLETPGHVKTIENTFKAIVCKSRNAEKIVDNVLVFVKVLW